MDGFVLPHRELFWDPARYGHWEFPRKYVSRYWEMTLRKGVGIEEGDTRAVHRKEENRVCHQDLLSPWGRV